MNVKAIAKILPLLPNNERRAALKEWADSGDTRLGIFCAFGFCVLQIGLTGYMVHHGLKGESIVPCLSQMSLVVAALLNRENPGIWRVVAVVALALILLGGGVLAGWFIWGRSVG